MGRGHDENVLAIEINRALEQIRVVLLQTTDILVEGRVTREEKPWFWFLVRDILAIKCHR